MLGSMTLDPGLLDAPIASEFATLCDMLSHRHRLQVLLILRSGEQSVTSLVRRLGIRQPAVSHHLALLRQTGLVRTRRAGKTIFYSAAAHHPDDLVATRHLAVRLVPA